MASHARIVLTGSLPSTLSEEAAAVDASVRMGFPRWLSPFLFSGVVGITLGRRIYLSTRILDRGEDYLTRLVRHELAHVAQVREQGGLIPFLYHYLEEYLGHRRDGFEIDEAYERISFEVHARRAEQGAPSSRSV